MMARVLAVLLVCLGLLLLIVEPHHGVIKHAHGQVSCGVGSANGVFGGCGVTNQAAAGGCAAATNFLARTSGANISVFTTFICGLVTDGLITGTLAGAAGCGTLFDGIYIWTTNSTANALLNLCGTNFGLTSNGTMTFTANQGYVSGGSNTVDFLDTGANLSSFGGKFTQNSGHISVWDKLIGFSTAQQIAGDKSGGTNEILVNFGGNAFFRLNNAGGINVSNGGVSGLYLANRSAVSADQGYINGASVATGTDTSTAPTDVLTFPGYNAPSIDPLRGATFGASLNSTQVGNLYSRWSTLVTAIAGSIP